MVRTSLKERERQITTVRKRAQTKLEEMLEKRQIVKMKIMIGTSMDVYLILTTSDVKLFSFPMREMIELSEFLGETNNRSRTFLTLSSFFFLFHKSTVVIILLIGAERRGSRTRNNGTNGAGPSRRNGPRSSMSRRAVKRARLAESENHDEVISN